MTQDGLKIILEKHGKWLRNEIGGKKADLSGSNLRGSNLSGSNLSWSDLSGSNLSRSDLSRSNLRGSDIVVIHPGPWEMIVSKTHVHVGCERFPNDKKAETVMRILAKKHDAQDFLKLYVEFLKVANKLMKLSAAAAKKEKCT